MLSKLFAFAEAFCQSVFLTRENACAEVQEGLVHHQDDQADQTDGDFGCTRIGEHFSTTNKTGATIIVGNAIRILTIEVPCWFITLLDITSM